MPVSIAAANAFVARHYRHAEQPNQPGIKRVLIPLTALRDSSLEVEQDGDQ